MRFDRWIGVALGYSEVTSSWAGSTDNHWVAVIWWRGLARRWGSRHWPRSVVLGPIRHRGAFQTLDLFQLFLVMVAHPDGLLVDRLLVGVPVASGFVDARIPCTLPICRL